MTSRAAAASSSTVVQLARRVLKSSNSAPFASDTLSSFQELTSIIASTNPPPVIPRVPDAQHGPNASEKNASELEQRFQRILVKPNNNILGKSRNIQTSNEQPSLLLPELNQANSTYGTTPAASIQILLNVLYPPTEARSKARGPFVDAGSGQGVPTLAAALSGRFPLAKGIEYQSKWHESAVALKAAYEKEQEQTLRYPQNDCDKFEQGARCQLEYVFGDMTEPDAKHFVGASCVFLNGVTFDAKMCQAISHRLEDELVANANTKASKSYHRGSEDVFVVSMSRKLALPSFDLVDVLSLNANGDGMFTFYVHRRAPSSIASVVSLHHRATSDSEIMRVLRAKTNFLKDDRKGAGMKRPRISIGFGSLSLIDELVNVALSLISNEESDDQTRLGMSFLAALAASEPTVRQNMSKRSRPRLWRILQQSMFVSASLTEKVLGSMVLRAMADHSIGRSIIAENNALVDLLLASVDNHDEHPAIRANILDVLSQMLHDFPMTRVSKELDQVLLRITTISDQEATLLPSNLSEALAEAVEMQRWWGGHRKYIPNAPPIQ